MGKVEDDLVDNFLANLAHYLPEAASYASFKKAPAGNYYGVTKEVDVLLVERTSPSSGVEEWSRSIGIPFARPKREKAGILASLPPNTKVWVVEAESSRKSLWDGIGQTFGYRALISMDNRGLWVAGSAVLIPDYEERDELIESVAQAIRTGLGIDLRIIRVSIARPSILKKGNADLRPFIDKEEGT